MNISNSELVVIVVAVVNLMVVQAFVVYLHCSLVTSDHALDEETLLLDMYVTQT